MRFRPLRHCLRIKRRKGPVSAAAVQVETVEDRLLLAAEYAPIDGFGNNLDNAAWGSVDVDLIRLASVEYSDGISEPAGADRPGAREVSNAVVAQDESITNDRYLTDLVWLWGQFVDHDIDLTENADPAEPLPIEVPLGDPYFDPGETGTETIDFNRSVTNPDTGDSASNPRQQINQITAFIDGSVVYGSDQERADALRAFEGGLLKTSDGNLLPFNEDGLPNAGGEGAELFLAGDVRANENAALTAMQTLFVREHNRLAGEIAAGDPTLTDEEIYQQARAQVTAEIQAITYNEFLPALLGPDALGPYAGYDPTVNPGISNIFSTAAYRLGHSMLSSELLRLDQDGNVIDAGNLSLQDAFFASDEIVDYGIESLLLGLASQQAQEIDTMIVDDVRNLLFGEPGSGGFDLASLNIQRGRDHGLPDYNQARIDLELEPVMSFSEITSDVELQLALESVYGDVNSIDVWVGGLAEDHLPNSSVGELINTVLVDQFERLRAGDRFWYQNVFEGSQLAEIENTTLSDIIQRNTEIADLRENVFFDESVMYYRVAYGHDPADMSISMRGGDVVMVDNTSGETLRRRNWQDVSQVILMGSDQGDDRFVVDIGNRHYDLPGGVVVHGGQESDHDTMIVMGTRRRDSIFVDQNEATVNGESIQYSGMEKLVVQARSGSDYVEILGEPEPVIVVYGGFGSDHIYGSPGDDYLYGGPGNDWIYGNGGDDLIVGGPGRDHIHGHGRHHWLAGRAWHWLHPNIRGLL